MQVTLTEPERIDLYNALYGLREMSIALSARSHSARADRRQSVVKLSRLLDQLRRPAAPLTVLELDGEERDTAAKACMILAMAASQALAGGRFDVPRDMTREAMLERMAQQTLDLVKLGRRLMELQTPAAPREDRDPPGAPA